jgi:predicted metal-dependent enzyme (double-stranded beta helix superfamily)
MPHATLAPIDRDLGLERTVRAFARRPELWEPLVRYAEPRLRIPLTTSRNFEVKLLTWAPGQGTGLHDHGGSSGCLIVLRGAVVETTVDDDGRLVDHVRHAHDVSSFSTDLIHDVRNEGSVGAVTLHAYRPFVMSMTKYVHQDGQLRPTGTLVAGRDY